MMFGGIFAYRLIDILGRKKNYIIITPFYIAIVISFFFIKGKNLLTNGENSNKNEDIIFLVPELVLITGIENDRSSKRRRCT